MRVFFTASLVTLLFVGLQPRAAGQDHTATTEARAKASALMDMTGYWGRCRN